MCPPSYDEGPYKNWTAVNFLNIEWRVEVADVGWFWFVSFLPYEVGTYPGDVATGVSATRMQAIITGADSDESVDLRTWPINTTPIAPTNIVADSCLTNLTSGAIYDYPSGAAVSLPTGDVGVWAYIEQSVSADTGTAALYGNSTYTLVPEDPGPPVVPAFCSPDNNPATRPPFINGELLTLTQE